MTDDSLTNEDYLEKKLRCLVEPMITSLLTEKPHEPILFMIEWLQNFSGVGNMSGINSERAELHFLRKEMAKYSKKFNIEEEEDLKSESSEDLDEEEADKIEEEIQQRKVKLQTKGQRVSVSAEAYGNYNIKKEFVPKIIKKTEDQKKRISEKLNNSILFNTLEQNEKETVLNAFTEHKYKLNDLIINQGDQGDVLYLVESGYFECYKKFVSLYFINN